MLRRGTGWIGDGIILGEGLVDGGDAVGDPLGLGDQLLGALDLAGDGGDQRIGQAREILGLVDQRLGLVLDLLDLVVDLLQLARRRKRPSPCPVRQRRLRSEELRPERADGGAGAKHVLHGEISFVSVAIMSAAQSRPLCLSQASANFSRPKLATRAVMAAWSDFEDAAVKASATSDSPSSKRRLPRRDWQ